MASTKQVVDDAIIRHELKALACVDEALLLAHRHSYTPIVERLRVVRRSLQSEISDTWAPASIKRVKKAVAKKAVAPE